MHVVRVRYSSMYRVLVCKYRYRTTRYVSMSIDGAPCLVTGSLPRNKETLTLKAQVSRPSTDVFLFLYYGLRWVFSALDEQNKDRK